MITQCLHDCRERPPHFASSSLKSAGADSFDHFVGAAKQVQRERKTECFSGPEVDDQLDLRGLLYRQVGGLLAFENSTRRRYISVTLPP